MVRLLLNRRVDMRTSFTVLTVILVFVGFIIPLAWIGAIMCGLLIIASAPPGLRPDGKRRTGGLFGGLIDDIAIGMKMKDCPYCKSKIHNDAVRCPYCTEWLSTFSPQQKPGTRNIGPQSRL